MSSLPIGLLPHHGIKPYTTMCHHCPSGFSLIMASSHTQPYVITAHRASPSSWHQAILITAHRASPSPSSWHLAIHNHVSSRPIGLLPHHGIKPYTILCPHCPLGLSVIIASSPTQSCVITAHRASYSLRHHSHTHVIMASRVTHLYTTQGRSQSLASCPVVGDPVSVPRPRYWLGTERTARGKHI